MSRAWRTEWSLQVHDDANSLGDPKTPQDANGHAGMLDNDAQLVTALEALAQSKEHVQLASALEHLARAEEELAAAKHTLGNLDEAQSLYESAARHYAEAAQEAQTVAEKRRQESAILHSEEAKGDVGPVRVDP